MGRKYENYEVNDFLKDKSFLLWRKFQIREENGFWENFKTKYPEQASNFERAKQVVDSAKMYDSVLSSEELKDVDNIYVRTTQLYRGRTKKVRYIYFMRAAAVVAVVFAFSLIYYMSRPGSPFNEPDCVVTVSGMEDLTGDIQLILGQKDKMVLAKDADIVIDENRKVVITEKENLQSPVQREVEKEQLNTLIVPKGRRSSLTFSDGTKVWVNSGSRITFPSEFAANRREITLNEGEVYLEVVKNETKPFLVKTNFGSVKVLGTCFNILSYQADNIKSVVLAEGSIEVAIGSSEKLRLVPNQILKIQDGNHQISTVEADSYTCWKDGIMKFTNEKLETVLLRLSRYYGIEFTCDEKLKTKACSGKMFLFDDLDGVLETLSDIFPIEICKDETKIDIQVKP